jgi:hypothetical protein
MMLQYNIKMDRMDKNNRNSQPCSLFPFRIHSRCWLGRGDATKHFWPVPTRNGGGASDVLTDVK